MARWSETTLSTSPEESSLAPAPDLADFDNDFGARPLAEQIRQASVILLVQRKDEGGRHRAIISEILKRAPEVRLYYDIGDEYESLTHAPRDQCQDCEGKEMWCS
jgi:hypothetical protein